MNSSSDRGSGIASDSPVEPPAEPSVESLGRPAQCIVLLYLLSATVYLAWRATTLNPAAPIFSWLVYGAELLAFGSTQLQLYLSLKLSRRSPAPAAPSGLAVDLLILAGDEPAAGIRSCLLAARNVDYPHATWLLDAGDRDELRALAGELGARHVASRTPQAGRHQRLNAALAESSADFIAIVAADQAPKRSLLDATLGHFRDPRLAFVQTARAPEPVGLSVRLAGGPSVRAMQSEQVQRSRDCGDAVLYGGSAAVFRRSALTAVGGFPIDEASAELETSLALHKLGLHSIRVAEAQSFGTAPDGSPPSQAERHLDAALRRLWRERLFLRGRLTPVQRLHYLAATLPGLGGWLQTLGYLAPAWMLLSGRLPLVASPALFLALFLPCQLLQLLARDEAGRGRAPLFPGRDFSAWAAHFADAGRVQSWPVALVAGLNLGAIGGALLLAASAWRAGTTPTLSTAGLCAAAIWASLNLLDVALAWYRLRPGHGEQRQARRFAIPLPASLRIDGGEITMTVDNISSTGARLYGSFPPRLKPGDALEGELYLPGDTLAFQARVAALLKPEQAGQSGHEGQYQAALGIAFAWPDTAVEDRLTLFLHGSDLHWQFGHADHHADQAGTTLRERLIALLRKAAVDPLAGKHWAAIRYDADGEPAHGLISVASSPGPRVVVTAHQLPLSEPLQASKFSRRQPQGLRITPRRELARLSTPTSTLYLTEVKASAVLEPMRGQASLSAAMTPLLPLRRHAHAPS